MTMQQRIRLIGISGKIASGKDTIAEMIQYNQWHPDTENGWQVVKFADELKLWVARALGLTREQLEDPQIKNTYLGDEWSYVREERRIIAGEVDMVPIRYYLNPRLILQKLGTEVGRSIHSNFWINVLFAKWQMNSRWIITDVRFINEAMAVLDKGGILIRVNRDDVKRLGKPDTHPHVSETALDNFNMFTDVIDNNGSLQDLREQVNMICTKYSL
jgi:hypothetical protein